MFQLLVNLFSSISNPFAAPRAYSGITVPFTPIAISLPKNSNMFNMVSSFRQAFDLVHVTENGSVMLNMNKPFCITFFFSTRSFCDSFIITLWKVLLLVGRLFGAFWIFRSSICMNLLFIQMGTKPMKYALAIDRPYVTVLYRLECWSDSMLTTKKHQQNIQARKRLSPVHRLTTKWRPLKKPP